MTWSLGGKKKQWYVINTPINGNGVWKLMNTNGSIKCDVNFKLKSKLCSFICKGRMSHYWRENVDQLKIPDTNMIIYHIDMFVAKSTNFNVKGTYFEYKGHFTWEVSLTQCNDCETSVHGCCPYVSADGPVILSSALLLTPRSPHWTIPSDPKSGYDVLTEIWQSNL